jgi:uncharacterized protein YcfL
MKYFSVLVLALLCIGCGNLQSPQKAQSTSATIAVPQFHFVIYGSAGETFLVDTDTGKVWRYEAKDKTFLEVPVTSKIIKYDSHGNRVEPDSKDPLGILDKLKPNN